MFFIFVHIPVVQLEVFVEQVKVGGARRPVRFSDALRLVEQVGEGLPDGGRIFGHELGGVFGIVGLKRKSPS